jgi:hypothetical protein
MVLSMDWIERVLHISPDGGDGTLELLIAIGVVGIAMLVALRKRIASVWRKAIRRQRASAL